MLIMCDILISRLKAQKEKERAQSAPGGSAVAGSAAANGKATTTAIAPPGGPVDVILDEDSNLYFA
jgi:hypothetical protein